MAWPPRFNADLHPRGNPTNKGEFARKTGGPTLSKPGQRGPGAPAPKAPAVPNPVKGAQKATPAGKPKSPTKRPINYEPSTATAKLHAAAAGPDTTVKDASTAGPGKDWTINSKLNLDTEMKHRLFAAATNKHQMAAAAEPAISAAVQQFTTSNGGHLERFDYRLKEPDSLYRKIGDEMVDKKLQDDPEKAAAGIRDSVRFTAVLPDEGYWEGAERVGAQLEAAGFTRKKVTKGWAQYGYRGRNDTYESPMGVEFEVQYHTAKSLEVAEINHDFYNIARDTSGKYSDAERAKAEADSQRWFDTIPVPSNTPIIDGDKNVIGTAGAQGDKVAAQVATAHTDATRVPEGMVRSTDYGMQFDPRNELKLTGARSVSDEQWNTLPVEQLPVGTPLQANEEFLKTKPIDKVVSGREPFREGYVTKLFRDDKGNLHVADGHHRVAMHHALKKPMPVRIMSSGDVGRLGGTVRKSTH